MKVKIFKCIPNFSFTPIIDRLNMIKSLDDN